MGHGAKAQRLFGHSLVVFIALLATMSFSVGRVGSAAAQDATPMASPAAGPCDAPALPPGTPTPQEATPAMDMASPAAAETEAAGEATAAVVEEAAQATPADDATATEAAAAATNLANCINGGNFEGAVALMTTKFMESLFGTGNPYDVLAQGVLAGTQLGNFATGAVSTYDDGSVSVEISYMGSKYQVSAERWFLVRDGEYWKIDALEQINPEPEGDTAVVGINLTEYAMEPNATSVVESPVLIFHGINAGAEAHEIAVYVLPEGTTVEQVLADPDLQNQTEFIAQRSYEPGEQGDIALINLPPGKYTLVCLFTAPDGELHAAKGMYTEIEVTAAES